MNDTVQPPQNADTPARRAMVLGGVLLAVVLLVFVLGKLGILPSGEAMTAWMDGMADSPWGLPALIVVFCVAAFLGVPQSHCTKPWDWGSRLHLENSCRSDTLVFQNKN